MAGLPRDGQAGFSVKRGFLLPILYLRGGSQIDGILEGQAQFKDSAETVGQVAATVGTHVATQGLLYNDSDMSMAGGAIALIGLFAGAMSAAAKPAADTRHWVSLPGWISATSHPADLDDELDIYFHPSQGPSYQAQARLDSAANGCRLVYLIAPEVNGGSDTALARKSVSDSELSRTMRRNADRDSRFLSALLASFSRPYEDSESMDDGTALARGAWQTRF